MRWLWSRIELELGPSRASEEHKSDKTAGCSTAHWYAHPLQRVKSNTADRRTVDSQNRYCRWLQQRKSWGCRNIRFSRNILEDCDRCYCFTVAPEVKCPQTTVTHAAYRADLPAHLHTTLLRVGSSDEIMRADDGKLSLMNSVECGGNGNPRLVVTCFRRKLVALEVVPVTPHTGRTRATRRISPSTNPSGTIRKCCRGKSKRKNNEQHS